MKMTEPIGSSLYAPVFIRCTLGLYFVLAGLTKLENLGSFIAEIQGFRILPDHLATLYAIMLPYLEIGAGGLLVLGAWTTLAALASSLILLSFIYVLGLFPSSATLLFNKDIILLGASLSVLYSGAGAYSIDRFRKNSA